MVSLARFTDGDYCRLNTEVIAYQFSDGDILSRDQTQRVYLITTQLRQSANLIARCTALFFIVIGFGSRLRCSNSFYTVYRLRC